MDRFEPYRLGREGSGGDTQPSGPGGPLDFLTPAEWGQTRQVARHLSGGASGVGRPVICEVHLPGPYPPPSSEQQVSRGEAYRSVCDCDRGLAEASKELVAYALDEGLQNVEGWLDLGLMAEAVDELQCAVWAGGANRAMRAETCRHLSRKLAGFLEEASCVKSFWEKASGEANLRSQDFVQQAIELSRGLPHVEAWRACEPLEVEIADFVQRVTVGGYRGFHAEAAGNFLLLAEAVGDHMLQAVGLQDSLRSVEAECW